MNSPSTSGCPDFMQSRMSRRQALQVGGLGLAGLGLAQLLQAEARAAGRPRRATARSVILLFQFGGPSHLDTFDPKPQAPREIRGEFAAIRTRVPGIQVTEHLPRLARIADRFALVRSVHHNRSSHNPGAYYSLTGREPLIDIVTLNASAVDFPHPGAVVSYLDRKKRAVPAFVSLPTMIADGPFRTPGEFAGFLGKMHDPLWVLRNPNMPDFSAADLTLPPGVDRGRVADRQAVLKELDARSRLADTVAAVKGMRDYQARAVDLLTSPATKKAFALQQESDKVRDRYGRTTYGQSALLARRLVEAGVRFVTVYYSPGIGGWDTHAQNFTILKDSRLPQTDQTVSALLEDLDSRGLLEETLVYWTGDFGRTPRINPAAGRDHWPGCQTVLMAGGGIRGGQVYGTSDAHGARPREHPVKPDDITATVFHALGFEPETPITDQLSRPMPISAGRPITPLFGA
ncbi:MAG TPA: DUF1501 domain-containing protein [Gemmataceae bacterium]|jgi:uncharacterized protein (DUF1501 family)|nr:DUF1501 domain-containing protein [Gemmataceae bacterium]